MKNKLNFIILIVVFNCSGYVVWAEGGNGAAPPLSQALSQFLGHPFLADGAQNLAGQWVTFNQPDQPLTEGGFNCSGFTVAAVRKILDRPITLKEATEDRRGDSGIGSVLGQDWDFGFDLIVNLAQGYPSRFLPQPLDLESTPIDHSSGRPLGLGVDIHSPQLEETLAALQPGTMVLFAMSKPHRGFAAKVAYYHVGVILPEPPHLWLYHSTILARTNRIDLATSQGLARFRHDFRAIGGNPRRLLLLEVNLGEVPPAEINSGELNLGEAPPAEINSGELTQGEISSELVQTLDQLGVVIGDE